MKYIKPYLRSNESKENWLVKCITIDDSQKIMEEKYSEEFTPEELYIIQDIRDNNLSDWHSHPSYKKPVINDSRITYYFVTGSSLNIEKLEDEWFLVDCDIIRPRMFYLCDSLVGLSKLKDCLFKLREGQTDLDLDIIKESYDFRVMTKDEVSDVQDLFLTYAEEYDLSSVYTLTPLQDMIEGEYKMVTPSSRIVKIIICGSLPGIERFYTRLIKMGYECTFEENLVSGGVEFTKFTIRGRNIVNESHKEDLYVEISHNDYLSLIEKHETISPKDLKMIEDKVSTYGVKCNVHQAGSTFRQMINGFYNGRHRFTITKIYDEYFLINIHDLGRCYKCDGTDGLFDFLKMYLG